jgi:hypothetical protein
MRQDQLEHAIRTACQIIGRHEVIVVGSQSILGTAAHQHDGWLGLGRTASGGGGGRGERCQHRCGAGDGGSGDEHLTAGNLR